jgi:hypothetical protein
MGEAELRSEHGLGQRQNQQQTQILNESHAVTVNVQSAGDPGLESRILNEVHSVGRQLGAISAVVEVLLTAQRGSQGLALTPDAQHVIDKFTEIQADIRFEKQLREVEAALDEVRRHGRTAPKTQARDLCARLLKAAAALDSALRQDDQT